MVVEPDVGIVGHTDGHFTIVVAHVLHLDVGHLRLLFISDGDDNGVLTLVDAILGGDGMTAIVHISVVDGRLSDILAIDSHVRLGL